ncbi:MAG: polymer-forming cytoskeletal protein [Polyangiaceae bacterium]
MPDTREMSTPDPAHGLTGGAKTTVIEEGTEFKGSMSSSCAVVVRGRVQGDLTTPALTVAPSGVVQGRAKVGAIESQGQLSGEFDAESVRLSGVVSDDTLIRAKVLEVKLSSDKKMVVTFGESRLEVGEAPAPPKPA